ncbi:Gustatory receptor 21 [Cephus cinctus]|nr:Gustatory receptor 21 [Cephus cinctus]
MHNNEERLDSIRTEITKCFSKVNAISRIFGLSMGPINLSSKRTNYFSWTIYALLNILLVIVWSYLTEFAFQAESETEQNNSYSQTTKVEGKIKHMKLIGSGITIVILILLTPFTRKDLLNSLDELARIDNRLEMEFNFKLDYKKSSARSIHHLLTVMATFLVLFIKIHFSAYYNHIYRKVALWYFLTVYATLTKILIALQFVNLLFNLRDRFLILNSRLKNILPEVQQQDFVRKSFHENCTIYRRLRIAAEIHQDLTEAAGIANKTFGIQMLVDLSYTFMIITSELYVAIMTLRNAWNLAIDYLNCSIVHAIQWICIVAACNSIIRQMRKVIVTVHKISLNSIDFYSHAVAQDFFYKEPHQKFEFTAYGFFTIDSTILTSVVASVTTYLVFLIQFDSFPISGGRTYINVTTLNN